MLFAIFGSILLAFAIVAVLVGSHPWLFWAHLAGGLGCLAYAAATGFGDLRQVLGRDAGRRGVRQASNAVVQTIAIAVILALLAFLAVRYRVRFDWTESKVHTLAEATRNVLEQIPGDGTVEILAFYTRGAQEPARKLLDLYEDASDRLSYRIVDANRRPDLATRFEIQRDGVMIVCGVSCEAPEGTTRIGAEQPSEQDITKAIRSVISEQRKIYFLTGHGEGDVANEEASGYSRAKISLEDENHVVEPLLLANQPEVPGDAHAVVIAGPTHSILPRELEALDRFLRGGGGVLVLSDPLVITNLEPTVREWGVELGNDVIVDQQIQLFAGPSVGVQPIVQTYGSHPITERMEGRPTLFQVARSVRSSEGSSVTSLFSTGSASWAETDLERFTGEGVVGLDEAADRPGPIDVAMARTFESADGEREGRLVVVGDADFARNRYAAEFFNADLFLNMMSWLIAEEQFITIERRLPRASRAAMTPQQFENFRYIALFVMPELILLLGIVNWWRRRT